MTDAERKEIVARFVADCHDYKCRACGGGGVVGRADHDPMCDGSCRNCPIEVPDRCDQCGGGGVIESDLTVVADTLRRLLAMEERARVFAEGVERPPHPTETWNECARQILAAGDEKLK